MPETISIVVKQPSSDRMGSSIDALIDVLYYANNAKTGDSVIFDLKNIAFVHPFLVLPIAALIQYFKQIDIKVTIEYPLNPSSKAYLYTIFFSEGLNPITYKDWEEKLSQYQAKTYLPIIAVPVKNGNELIKNKILSAFEQIMQNQLNLELNLLTAIKYISGEAFDNIDQHADVDNGWIMLQNYQEKEYLDVCILDTGKGLLKSYQDAGFNEIKTHQDALQEATNGRSTKINEKTRGFGIMTSKKMLVEGLKGKYFLLTGNAFYVWTEEHKNISVLNDKNNWQGTMLALSIPKTTPKDFDYINYLE